MDTRIGLLFLFTISSCIALECSTCTHVAIEYTNMPASIEGPLNAQMSTLNSLRNEQCVSNSAPTETCEVAGPGFNDTCTSLTFTMTCMGFQTADLANAGMTIEIVDRECSASPEGTEDTCRKLNTLGGAESQAAILLALQSLTTQFDSVKYNGEYCTSTTNSGSSTMILMPSVAVVLIASYLV
ncbi:uncharacterized protein LOC128242279 [Mya arenaria]|uniref:uncharacterized protein LOC128242279 n=1 Tax=Mya arenaria TaxID=6604 RepID=UPI0022E59AD9|nr:uncharacterized protein LOC128242279 [Mya arenaria]